MIVLIFHGSRDPDHNLQAAELARALGLGYAFMETEPRFSGGVGVPMFVADGADYRHAAEVATVKAPPLLRWPGFADYLKGLGAQLYIFHGPDRGDVAALGLPVAFLEGEPSIEDAPCVEMAAPVVLTRGYIYKKIAAKYSRCQANLLPPLAEQPTFIEYLRRTLPIIISRYRQADIATNY
ncbi:hypothetical protein [Pyrobaculum arsenaticum]|uniref:Uncharacterized protein n=1 Tax=Pyrobaculum arsenaticum (strain DSM 13514 / JCM 11321 / PZ6) TaxID=340102 RepID=A4WN36_PYRAR|nr:hypothetical protein [Pyrobaculum arsenaticum]ABP51803.1 conserved hypothetical protein [Pyrobaculum arsenaticum DSM 13514]